MKYIIAVLFLWNTLALLAQNKHFCGTWTKENTTYQFNFNLQLSFTAGQGVEGYFDWALVRFDEYDERSSTYYKNKIGATAREYVRGTYNSSTKSYILKGYKKDDPQHIISLDTYYLMEDENREVSGTSDAHGSQKGRINGKCSEKELP